VTPQAPTPHLPGPSTRARRRPSPPDHGLGARTAARKAATPGSCLPTTRQHSPTRTTQVARATQPVERETWSDDMTATLEQPQSVSAKSSKKPANTLVVGHCRDTASDHALAVAAELGRQLGAQLHVVHVVVLDDYPIDPDAADWEEQGERILTEERHHVEAALIRTGLPWTYQSCRGNPAKALAAAADEHNALMIVVGTRGEGLRATLSRLIQPSVSHALIEYQRRPVLIVPPTQLSWAQPNLPHRLGSS
jgi:nucleotide-binding universal stress UspA family protein